MATFTSSGGLTKPATGEYSGTWGNYANTNFDIIDRLVNGVVSIPLTATPYALSTSDGILSTGQYLLINFTGTLGGTVTVNIMPQDATKIYFIRNSSNSSVVMSQGSGSTVTVPSGQSKLVYTDGLGASASTFDFTSILSMSGVQITGGAISGASVATSSATITGGTITGITDLAVADGGTGASTLTGYVKGAGTVALTASATIPSTDISGIGTMAAQNSSSVTITGGTITGITDLAITDGGTGSSTAAGVLVNLGITATAVELNYSIGVTSAIQTQLGNKISSNADAALTGGYTTTADIDGTFSTGTYTPVPSGGNMKSITNGGAFTLAAPSATGDYTLIIRMVNNASAGTVTLSGFTKSGGDTLTTTNGNAFFLYITKCAGSVALIVQALQ